MTNVLERTIPYIRCAHRMFKYEVIVREPYRTQKEHIHYMNNMLESFLTWKKAEKAPLLR